MDILSFAVKLMVGPEPIVFSPCPEFSMELPPIYEHILSMYGTWCHTEKKALNSAMKIYWFH